jgi:DNA repair photolyase
MILNTGARTDTVQYFSKWLLKRFEEGYVFTRNPLFPNKVTRYELSPDKIDCVVFCSKNYQPILKNLHKITDNYNTYFHYTITAYGKDIEPGVPSIDESIETLYKLEKQVGKKRISWRYDPILLTDNYTFERHIETFEYMASKLSDHVNRCVFSFVEMYKKLERNMPEIIQLTDIDKSLFAENLGKIAKKYGLYIQTCGTNGDFSKYGIHKSGCLTLEMLGEANEIKFRNLKHKGMRTGCHCIESRDIGAYDTCLNGCKYCYANKNPQKAFQNFKFHDPDSPLLLGNLRDNDIIQIGMQNSFLKDFEQSELNI